MDLATALDFARRRKQGVLVTIRREGRPQISNLIYAMDDRGVARISSTEDTAKVKNLRRDPRCSLYVPGDNFWEWVVIEATAELSAVAQALGDDVVEGLITLYRSVSGEHPDWDEFRQAMVQDKRLIIQVQPERAYGMLRQ
jgi:PPOX class probable F420-dependent enzyme